MNNELSDLLIVVDMQNDFITGSLGSKDAEAIVPNVAERISEYINNNKDVIFTKDTHEKSYYHNSLEGRKLPIEHCIEDTWGHELHQAIKKFADKLGTQCIKYKNTFGAQWSVLQTRDFINLKSIEICGLCTDICVVSNVLILRSCCPEVEITVNSKLCAGTTRENHEAALKVMRSCLVNVI